MKKQKTINTKKLNDAIDDFKEYIKNENLGIMNESLKKAIVFYMKKSWEEAIHNAIQKRNFT